MAMKDDIKFYDNLEKLIVSINDSYGTLESDDGSNKKIITWMRTQAQAYSDGKLSNDRIEAFKLKLPGVLENKLAGVKELVQHGTNFINQNDLIGVYSGPKVYSLGKLGIVGTESFYNAFVKQYISIDNYRKYLQICSVAQLEHDKVPKFLVDRFNSRIGLSNYKLALELLGKTEVDLETGKIKYNAFSAASRLRDNFVVISRFIPDDVSLKVIGYTISNQKSAIDIANELNIKSYRVPKIYSETIKLLSNKTLIKRILLAKTNKYDIIAINKLLGLNVRPITLDHIHKVEDEMAKEFGWSNITKYSISYGRFLGTDQRDIAAFISANSTPVKPKTRPVNTSLNKSRQSINKQIIEKPEKPEKPIEDSTFDRVVISKAPYYMKQEFKDWLNNHKIRNVGDMVDRFNSGAIYRTPYSCKSILKPIYLSLIENGNDVDYPKLRNEDNKINREAPLCCLDLDKRVVYYLIEHEVYNVGMLYRQIKSGYLFDANTSYGRDLLEDCKYALEIVGYTSDDEYDNTLVGTLNDNEGSSYVKDKNKLLSGVFPKDVSTKLSELNIITIGDLYNLFMNQYKNRRIYDKYQLVVTILGLQTKTTVPPCISDIVSREFGLGVYQIVSNLYGSLSSYDEYRYHNLDLIKSAYKLHSNYSLVCDLAPDSTAKNLVIKLWRLDKLDDLSKLLSDNSIRSSYVVMIVRFRQMGWLKRYLSGNSTKEDDRIANIILSRRNTKLIAENKLLAIYFKVLSEGIGFTSISDYDTYYKNVEIDKLPKSYVSAISSVDDMIERGLEAQPEKTFDTESVLKRPRDISEIAQTYDGVNVDNRGTIYLSSGVKISGQHMPDNRVLDSGSERQKRLAKEREERLRKTKIDESLQTAANNQSVDEYCNKFGVNRGGKLHFLFAGFGIDSDDKLVEHLNSGKIYRSELADARNIEILYKKLDEQGIKFNRPVLSNNGKINPAYPICLMNLEFKYERLLHRAGCHTLSEAFSALTEKDLGKLAQVKGPFIIAARNLEKSNK